MEVIAVTDMRRKDKQIKNQERVDEILHRAQVGRLGTISANGTPMIKPVNFLYQKGKVYFHSAPKGEKIDHLASSSKVCFEVDEPLAYIPATDSACDASFAYQSVIVEGKARLIQDPEQKIAILNALTEKHQPGANLRPLDKKMVQGVVVVEITPEKMTGKEIKPPQS